MDRGLAIDDRGAAQILGFIVGLVVVTASLAIAAYFIVTVPEGGADETSQQLQGDSQRAIETLTTTPGEPSNWSDDFSNDTLRRVGLLEADNHERLDQSKIELIQDGNLTADRILQSWDMNTNTTGLRIEGRVQPVSIGGAPGVETYGVAHANASDTTLDWEIPAHSREAAQVYSKVNPDYQFQPHHWQFGFDVHPDNGQGNTVPDHAWFVETQLLPMMTGIDATFSTSDQSGGSWGSSSARQQAFDDYVSDKGPTRWHVVANKTPHEIPQAGEDTIGEHALTVNWRHPKGSDSNGLGQWRVQEGARSTALLDGIQMGSASSAQLEFDHLLRVETENRDLCQHPDDDSCTMVRSSILFWNTTANHWTRLARDAAGCPASGWDDVLNGDGNTTTSGWESSGPIELCEAVEHSGDKLWLSLFWETECVDSNGNNVTCSDKPPHGWFVDNIEVTSDSGTTLYATDFEPPTGRSSQALFVSNGVDHNRTYDPGPDGAEDHAVGYLQNMVEAGGNVVALAPDDPTPSDSTPGDWLSRLGLYGTTTTPSDDVTTEDPKNIVFRFPNDVPETAPDYRRENVTWAAGERENLTIVQAGPNGDATLLQGQPYEDGGRVAALAYNHTHFTNETLRKELYENLHASSVFIDPTFTVGDDLPDGGSEVASDRRVVLVGVTPDNRFVVPLEITLWMWRHG